MRIVYAVLCLVGAAWPLTFFFTWLMQNGFDISLLIAQAYSTPISAFAWSDVIVSALVLLAFIVHETRRESIRHSWVAICALFTVGVSLALPLFLLLRENQKIARTLSVKK